MLEKERCKAIAGDLVRDLSSKGLTMREILQVLNFVKDSYVSLYTKLTPTPQELLDWIQSPADKQ